MGLVVYDAGAASTAIQTGSAGKGLAELAEHRDGREILRNQAFLALNKGREAIGQVFGRSANR